MPEHPLVPQQQQQNALGIRLLIDALDTRLLIDAIGTGLLIARGFMFVLLAIECGVDILVYFLSRSSFNGKCDADIVLSMHLLLAASVAVCAAMLCCVVCYLKRITPHKCITEPCCAALFIEVNAACIYLLTQYYATSDSTCDIFLRAEVFPAILFYYAFVIPTTVAYLVLTSCWVVIA